MEFPIIRNFSFYFHGTSLLLLSRIFDSISLLFLFRVKMEMNQYKNMRVTNTFV